MTSPSDSPSVSERQGYIGGSDAAAILGLSPFCTPFVCFAQKRGIEVVRAPDPAREEKFEFGHAMEPVIAAKFTSRTGIEAVRGVQGFYRGTGQVPEYVGGHVDFVLPTLDSFLECKNVEFRSNEWLPPEGSDNSAQIPIYYLAQCDHYMWLLHCNFCYLAVLFGGCWLVCYRIERSAQREAILAEAEMRFWQRVIEDDPPAFEGVDDLIFALQSRYLKSLTSKEALALKQNGRVQLDDVACQLLDELRTVRTTGRAARQQELTLREALLKHLNGATGYLHVGSEKWGSLLMSERKYLDDFALQMEEPEIYARYLRSRLTGPVLRLTGDKDDSA